MNKLRAETANVQTLLFDATNGFPTTRAYRYSFTPTRLQFRATTQLRGSSKPSSPMASHHNGDMGFTATTTTIPKVMKCLASPAVELG